MSTILAWRVVRHGRPSAALALQQIPEPTPGPGQARVRHTYVAVNFMTDLVYSVLNPRIRQ